MTRPSIVKDHTFALFSFGTLPLGIFIGLVSSVLLGVCICPLSHPCTLVLSLCYLPDTCSVCMFPLCQGSCSTFPSSLSSS